MEICGGLCRRNPLRNRRSTAQTVAAELAFGACGIARMRIAKQAFALSLAVVRTWEQTGSSTSVRTGLYGVQVR
jgi:hypothetical protein